MEPSLLAIACLALVGALVLGEHQDWPRVRALSKTTASLLFIAFALSLGASSAGTAGKLVVLGLTLGAVGDVALLSREKVYFRVGLGSFLLAHVAYVGAFLLYGLRPLAMVGALAPVAVVAVVVYRWLSERVGEVRVPVVAYIAVISLMVACAVGVAAWEGTRLTPDGGLDSTGPVGWRVGLLAAAVLFYLSDLCVARDRFVAPGFPNRLVGLPLYYVAQLLFGLFAGRAG